MRCGATIGVLAAVVLALAACGDNLTPDPGRARSGARLAIARYVFEDGTAHAETRWFHDRELDARCTPQRWSDGHTYCTPEAGPTVFVEETCTLERGQVVPVEGVLPETPHFFLRRYAVAGELLPSRLYAAGARVAPPTQLWERRNGVCAGPITADVDATYVALLPVEVMRIRQLEVAAGDELALVVSASDDGLRAPAAWHDRERGRPCRIEVDAEGAAICAPEAAPTTMYFHDGGCSLPELALASASNVPDVVRYRNPYSGCTTHHELDLKVGAPPLYYYAGDSCLPVAAPLLHAFYLLGPALELPAVTRAPIAAEGRRLQPIELTAGSIRTPDHTLYDTTLATECRPTELAGPIRCVPVTSTEVVFYYAEDRCEARLSLARLRADTCADPPGFAIAHAATGTTVHAIGAPPSS